MPHSISPEASPADDSTLPLADAQPLSNGVKEEPSSTSQDVTMSDAASPSEAEKNKVVLEGLFDDDDSDDEFSSSAPQIRPEEAPSPEPLKIKPSTTFSDPEVMRAFYQRLFPFRYLFQWLNHSPSPTNDFAHREFAFTLQNDAYLRYQSFPTSDLLRKQCIQMIPSRFEIGPVYSANPRDRKTLRKASAFRPLSKELVFDIDMTDYDDIRTCCTGANICLSCWSFITMAIKVVDVALREDFGFKHILWVYSGRRGAHAWVCDKRARDLDDQKRRAVAGYLELLKGGAQGGKKVNAKRPLHPHLERSLAILRDYFQTSILLDQDPWSSDRSAHLLDLLPDASLRAALQKKWDSAPSRPSSMKWADIDSLAASGALSTLDPKSLKEMKQDIVLEYTYPRLDAEVSKKLNHLLKSPFCVHPGTGRVCVPIDTRKVEEFDPLGVPTVTQLLGEIDTWDREHRQNEEVVVEEEDGVSSSQKQVSDWEKTSLKPYVDLFRGFVNRLLKDEKGVKREREEGGNAMEF
ncbi:eukaryotic and archaeal DNA primase small subunit [Lepidopterella palustris CBS 459.81]|uniref:DNA primase n=1 Tax=Lepidopterella palustris CBS 459.81 TaxID=1314670 RepID=A0A8E2E8X1_9PEZI|nr:eukaryotic and archaeal DNA primase small subunit [Lepidopterella palustris CBS 459.81]